MITFFFKIDGLNQWSRIQMSSYLKPSLAAVVLEQQLEQDFGVLFTQKKNCRWGDQLSAFPCTVDSSLSCLSLAQRHFSGLSSLLAGLLIPWRLTLALH